jgi:hypothetical protein
MKVMIDNIVKGVKNQGNYATSSIC